jgi:hypothetical protein
MLTGRRLRWMLGSRLLGTGAQITVSGLPAGRQRIVLRAVDSAGRVGRASLLVELKATRPLFLTLRSPGKIARRARSLRLAVTSSIPATLVVRIAGLRPQAFAVNRKTRIVTVRLPQGMKPLVLQLALSANRLTRSGVLVIGRT